MKTTQLLGIPMIIFGIYTLKWVFDDLKEDRIDWYATARDIGTSFFTILIGILMIYNKIEF